MKGSEPSDEPAEELDRLIERFAESGCAPDGAHVEGDDAGSHGHGHGHGADVSVRRFEYRGHEIEIITHYEVMIDGEPWEGHLDVQFDGTVTYHGLPQYAAPSAVGLVHGVIDAFYEAPEAVREAVRAAPEES